MKDFCMSFCTEYKTQVELICNNENLVDSDPMAGVFNRMKGANRTCSKSS